VVPSRFAEKYVLVFRTASAPVDEPNSLVDCRLLFAANGCVVRAILH
jgi:hypothetical protein